MHSKNTLIDSITFFDSVSDLLKKLERNLLYFILKKNQSGLHPQRNLVTNMELFLVYDLDVNKSLFYCHTLSGFENVGELRQPKGRLVLLTYKLVRISYAKLSFFVYKPP